MPLLDDQLRGRLPPLYSQEAETDPTVYARFHLPGTTWSWYAIEGEPRDSDFLLFCCFLSGDGQSFSCISLSALEALRGPENQPVERDATFVQGRLTDVVPAPDM